MLSLTILTALFNTTLIQVARKRKWLIKYALHHRKWMPDPECYLCLSFWAGCIEILVGVAVGCAPHWLVGDYLPALVGISPSLHLLFVPWCAAALSNFLVNNAFLIDLR